MWTRWISFAGRIVLGLVFLYAAYTKLKQPWLVFAMSIDSYQMLPEWAVLSVARTLPWFELLLGLALLIGYKLRFVALAATLILTVFFVLMLRAFGKGLGIDCGCFGVGEALSAKTLARDGSLLAIAILTTVLAFRSTSKNRSAVSSLS